MRKEIVIDLHGVKSKIDVILRFAKELSLNNGGLGWTEQSDANWDAFSDDLSGLSFPDQPDIKEVVLIVKGISDILKNISKEEYLELIDILACLTDPAQRVDGLNFFFQVRHD